MCTCTSPTRKQKGCSVLSQNEHLCKQDTLWETEQHPAIPSPIPIIIPSYTYCSSQVAAIFAFMVIGLLIFLMLSSPKSDPL